MITMPLPPLETPGAGPPESAPAPLPVFSAAEVSYAVLPSAVGAVTGEGGPPFHPAA